MMSPSQFAVWLHERRNSGETLKAIGDSLGVSHVTVIGWLSGRQNPSRMALVLAGELAHGPMEMAAGLPEPSQYAKCSAHLAGQGV
ncbi:MAG: hypothetical protein WA294_14075 [Acidobacteriaceae bacterium]